MSLNEAENVPRKSPEALIRFGSLHMRLLRTKVRPRLANKSGKIYLLPVFAYDQCLAVAGKARIANEKYLPLST